MIELIIESIICVIIIFVLRFKTKRDQDRDGAIVEASEEIQILKAKVISLEERIKILELVISNMKNK